MNPKKLLTYYNRAGWPFMAIFAGVTILLGFLSCTLFSIGVLLTAWCFYFFRDPARTVPTRQGLVVSPADGKIVAVKEVTPTADLALGDEVRWRISIFLNVFDVHVNRIPAEGVITERHYRAGKFVNAAFDKASDENERMALVLELGGDHPRRGRENGRRADCRSHRAAHRVRCESRRPFPCRRAFRHYPLRQPHGCVSAARSGTFGRGWAICVGR